MSKHILGQSHYAKIIQNGACHDYICIGVLPKIKHRHVVVRLVLWSNPLVGHSIFFGASLTFLHYFQEPKVISIFYKSKMDMSVCVCVCVSVYFGYN